MESVASQGPRLWNGLGGQAAAAAAVYYLEICMVITLILVGT